MPLSLVRFTDIPKRRRVSMSRFERTAEWSALRLALSKGVPKRKAIQVVLTAEDQARYRLTNLRLCARFVRRYLMSHGLNYACRAYRINGGDAVLVVHRFPSH